MVQLDCIEDGCSWKSKPEDLTFERAQVLLNVHLDRRHPLPHPAVRSSVPVFATQPTIPKIRKSKTGPESDSPPSDKEEEDEEDAHNENNHEFRMQQQEFYVSLIGFPKNDDSKTERKRIKEDIIKKYSEAGFTEQFYFAEDEAGKFTGMIVMKLPNVHQKQRVMCTEYSPIFGHKIECKEIKASEYYYYVQDFSGDSKYIRLKESWSRDYFDDLFRPVIKNNFTI